MLGLYAELCGIQGDKHGTRYHYAKKEIEVTSVRQETLWTMQWNYKEKRRKNGRNL